MVQFQNVDNLKNALCKFQNPKNVWQSRDCVTYVLRLHKACAISDFVQSQDCITDVYQSQDYITDVCQSQDYITDVCQSQDCITDVSQSRECIIDVHVSQSRDCITDMYQSQGIRRAHVCNLKVTCTRVHILVTHVWAEV